MTKVKIAVGLSGGVDSAVSAYLLKKQGFDPSSTLTSSRGLRPRSRRARLRGKCIALGLSGGVDSAVSAYLLKSYGYDVHCVYLNCFDSDIPGCRGDNDRKDALAVSMHLGLPFQVLDFRKEYQAAVIDYFKKEYLLGRTPNPDVVCNRDIKFGLFLDWAVKAGFDYVATGHYADGPDFSEGKIAGTPASAEKRATSRERIVREVGEWQAKAGATILRIPKDKHKDQTYFLWAVPRQKFSRVLFPLGNLLKTEVREIAKDAGLGVADKKDSTGICFVGEVRVEDFLKSLGVKEKVGEVVIQPQKVGPFVAIGFHRGVWFYTIGQRHGFSVDRWPPKNNTEYRMMNTEWKERLIPHSEFSIQNSVFLDRPPLYVIEKDIKKNRLIVGFGAETYREKFVVSDTNWLIPNTEYRILNKKQKKSSSDHSEFPARSGYAAPARIAYGKAVAGGGVAGGSIQNSKFKNCFVRIRHGGELIPCEINALTNQRINVSLSEAQRGIAPGQSAVFYLPRRSGAKAGSKKGIVLGGGVIQ